MKNKIKNFAVFISGGDRGGILPLLNPLKGWIFENSFLVMRLYVM